MNYSHQGYPVPSASAGDTPAGLFQAVDGRVWFYPEVRNYWSDAGSSAATDWFSLDFGREQSFRSVRLYFYADGAQSQAPARYTLQFWTGQDWKDVPSPRMTPALPLANGENTITFAPLRTSRLRAVFTNPSGAAVALVEMKAFG